MVNDGPAGASQLARYVNGVVAPHEWLAAGRVNGSARPAARPTEYGCHGSDGLAMITTVLSHCLRALLPHPDRPDGLYERFE